MIREDLRRELTEVFSQDSIDTIGLDRIVREIARDLSKCTDQEISGTMAVLASFRDRTQSDYVRGYLAGVIELLGAHSSQREHNAYWDREKRLSKGMCQQGRGLFNMEGRKEDFIKHTKGCADCMAAKKQLSRRMKRLHHIR